VKLNEFKKAKLNELDLSSFLGDYGSAAARTGIGSFGDKNVLSTTDQMAKDDFIKKFNSRALSGLQSAINGGLVDPNAAGKTSGANIGTNFGNNPAKNPVTNPITNPVTNPTTQVNPKAGKNVSPTPAQNRGAANTAGANAFGQMANQLSTAKKSPEQIRQEKQAAATGVAQQQMANNGPFSKLPANQAAVQAGNIRQQKQGQATTTAQGQMTPMSKLPADQFAKTAATTRQAQQGQAATAAQGQMTPKVAGPTPKTPEQIRQAKQLAATQAAQGQMNPMNKLPADQFNKSAANVRQQQQGVATQNAQDQMSPVSKLPADQFNKSADNVRQQQQTAATQTAQQQMSEPTTKAPSTLDKPYDPATGKGAKYDGVTGEPTPEWQKELDKQEAAREVEYQANRQKSQAAAAERDAQNAELVRQGVRQNPSNVTNNITQTSTAPGNVKISTADPAEIQSKMQAKIDAMKEKNPKLAAAMQAEIDDQFKQDKPDNTVQMPKRNKKPKGKAAESTQFDKLNYIFESILAEATMGQALSPGGKVVGQANQQQSKQTISQYITNFFKQFMKGVNISDPTVTTQVATLAKELEQTYSKDKGKSAIPKLADLAWSVSHAEGGQEPQQATTTPAQTGANPSSASAAATSNTTPQAAQASTQQAKMTAAQITKLMQGLSTRQKQSILKSLQAQLSKAPPTNKKQVTPPAKNNTVKMPKIKGAKAGLPTADEEAKFQQRIQQAQQK
jgi:hypothetical protein